MGPNDSCTLTLYSLFFSTSLFFFSVFPCFFVRVFPFFSKDFRGSAKRKPVFFWWVFLAVFTESKGWRVRVRRAPKKSESQIAAIFCRKPPHRRPNRNGEAFSFSQEIAKRIAIASNFPSQGEIARLAGRRTLQDCWGPKDRFDFHLCQKIAIA